MQLQQQQEIDALKQRLTQAQLEQTKEQRQALQQLANKQFTIGAESLSIELGSYDAEKQLFPVSIRSKIPAIKLAMNATIPLPRDAARAFKQQWQVGAVRPQGEVTAGGEMQKVALVNDGDGVVRECRAAICMSQQESDSLLYTDANTGLQWLRDGDFADKPMSWDDARIRVKSLSVVGVNDWRLPSKDELNAFFQSRGERPLMWFAVNGFRKTQSDYYWSDSIKSGFDVWCGYLGNEKIKQCDRKAKYYVWPVRDAK